MSGSHVSEMGAVDATRYSLCHQEKCRSLHFALLRSGMTMSYVKETNRKGPSPGPFFYVYETTKVTTYLVKIFLSDSS